MKTVKLTCQNCGANLDVKDNIAFCSYCGAKLIIDDENRTTTHNYNYTHIKRDEARIRENERKEKNTERTEYAIASSRYTRARIYGDAYIYERGGREQT